MFGQFQSVSLAYVGANVVFNIQTVTTDVTAILINVYMLVKMEKGY